VTVVYLYILSTQSSLSPHPTPSHHVNMKYVQDDRESMKHRYGIVFQHADFDGSSSSVSAGHAYVAIVAKKAYPLAAEQLPWDMAPNSSSSSSSSSSLTSPDGLADDQGDLEAGEDNGGSLFAAVVASSSAGKPAQFVV